MTVVLIDDHPILGLALRLELADEGVDAVVFESAPPDELISRVHGLSPTPALIVCDLAMPSVPDTAALVKDLVAICPVVILSGSDDNLALGRCLQSGALSVLSKDEPIKAIIGDIVSALRSGSSRPSCTVARLQEFERISREELRRQERFETLTRTERDVLFSMSEGKAAAQIATERYVSMPTVRSQIKAILSKLEVSSQLEAVALAYQLGFVSRIAESA